MEEITVKRDEGRATLRFTGELIGSAETSYERGHHNWSGETGRRQVYNLYRTAGGKFVGEIQHLTCWQGMRDSHQAEVLNGPEAVFSYFGDGTLAQELYEDAAQEFVQMVE